MTSSQASAEEAAGPTVALVAPSGRSSAALAAALRQAIPASQVLAWDALEDLPVEAASAAPALAVIDADALGAALVPTLEAAQHRFPACRLVVTATALDEADVQRAVQAGAMSYLPKGYTATQRELVLRLAWEGAGHLPRFVPGVVGSHADQSRPSIAAPPAPAPSARAQTLTPKQTEVLSYLAAGMPNRKIALRLGIQPGTVKVHVAEILRKLEVDSRSQAMLLARRLAQVQKHMLEHGERGSLVFDELMSHATHRCYRTGDVIFRIGDPGGELFYVQRGTVHLDEIGEEMQPGDIFGEIGVFSPERSRTSTARCKTDVEVFCLDADQAKRVYFESPYFALRIATLLAHRLVAERSH